MSANLAYLVSRYPAISHTFIMREVLELRNSGFRIEVASINATDRPAEQLTQEERAEVTTTFYIKAAGVGGALRAHAAVAAASPAAYLRGLLFALRLGHSDLRKIAMGALYFVEAVMIGHWMEARELAHLHVHFATPASTVGLIVAKTFDVKLSLTVHGPDEFYDVPGYRLAEKIAAATTVCAISVFARSQLMKICAPSLWRKIKVTPLGVDPAQFTPQSVRPHSDQFDVLCVGRLVPAKGQHILLAAVAKLISGGRKLRLRFVGDGPDRESLESAVQQQGLEKNVTFEGSVNQDHIRQFFEAADVFALASFAEGVPVVLMEAMAMQIPVISTWINGIPELIRDSVDGLLVAPSDVDALEKAIARLMDDRELRRRLGIAGRQRVIEKYNLRTNVAHLARIFDESIIEESLSQPALPKLKAVA